MSRTKFYFPLLNLAACLIGDMGKSSGRVITIGTKNAASEKLRLHNAAIKRMKSQGLKEWFFKEGSLYALNLKNAERKAKNKNWTLNHFENQVLPIGLS